LMNNVENLEICTVHKLPYKFYCPKDEIALCRRCKEPHNAHGVQGIETIAAEYLNEIAIKQDGLHKQIKEISCSLMKCQNALESLDEGYETSKSLIENKFKGLRQGLQWKEEEFLGEIENLYSRKKMEIQYFYESFAKNEKKIQGVFRVFKCGKDFAPEYCAFPDEVYKPRS